MSVCKHLYLIQSIEISREIHIIKFEMFTLTRHIREFPVVHECVQIKEADELYAHSVAVSVCCVCVIVPAETEQNTNFLPTYIFISLANKALNNSISFCFVLLCLTSDCADSLSIYMCVVCVQFSRVETLFFLFNFNPAKCQRKCIRIHHFAASLAGI